MENKNVQKPTSLFSIFTLIDTLIFGGVSQMKKNFKGELAIMDSMNMKPNYAALGRKYGMDYRTVKKYHAGYEGRPKTRNKGSKLDCYRSEIVDKLEIKRLTVQGLYKFMIRKYGVERIGTYSNFNKYIVKNKLKPQKREKGNPRYEKMPGEQAQVDWKEDISIANIYGEIFTINVLHVVLKYSRFSHLDFSIQKRFDDVSRGLINSFIKFGGVPKELLFDNMSTVANTQVKPKQPTKAIARMAKDFGFKIRFCKSRHPRTKGTVESKNKLIDHIRAYEGEFETIEELAAILETINQDMNITINQETDMSPAALYYKEKEYLKPLPNKSIIADYLTPNRYKVTNEALIKYGNSRYSVEPKLIGEEVTVDNLDNKLYIYYNGKLVTFHQLNENPINYKENHYQTLMEGKVKAEDMESIVTENLKMMDNLLENRTISVSKADAVKSEEALIAYINQSNYGKWIINHYAHLSMDDRLTFIKNVNDVLPYIANNENFISHIKFSIKQNMCRTIDFDCWVHDYMAASSCEYILSDEGYEIIKNKYKKQIDDLLEELRIEHEKEELEANLRYEEDLRSAPDMSEMDIILPLIDELPFE